MRKFLIRNDDVAFDTELSELKQFCSICDKYGYQIIQAITVFGECRKARQKMSNEEILASSDQMFLVNEGVVSYLNSRHDLIGVHGLWHTHIPTEREVGIAAGILKSVWLEPTYFVPPFNEGSYGKEFAGLKVCQLDLRKGERLEDFLDKGVPQAEIMYLHSWRFTSWYSFTQLENCLERLSKI